MSTGNLRAILTFLTGLLLGAVIWWASPMVTGESEPWDAPLWYYISALVIAGFTAALVSPRHFWLAPVGIYFGQVIYAFAFLAIGPLVLVGLFTALAFCSIALLGATIPFALSRISKTI